MMTRLRRSIDLFFIAGAVQGGTHKDWRLSVRSPDTMPT
jgi:hypothetical protein